MFSSVNVFLLSLSKSLCFENDRSTETVVSGTNDKYLSASQQITMLNSKKYKRSGFLFNMLSNLFFKLSSNATFFNTSLTIFIWASVFKESDSNVKIASGINESRLITLNSSSMISFISALSSLEKSSQNALINFFTFLKLLNIQFPNLSHVPYLVIVGQEGKHNFVNSLNIICFFCFLQEIF